MSLIQDIKAKQLELRKARDPVASVLTTLIGELEQNRQTKDAEVVAAIKKFMKNLDETIIAFAAQLKVGFGDLTEEQKMFDALRLERVMLELFLPKQLTDDELKKHVHEIHAGVLSMKDECKMGDIMLILKERFEGLYDGKTASAIVKAELA